MNFDDYTTDDINGKKQDGEDGHTKFQKFGKTSNKGLTKKYRIKR